MQKHEGVLPNHYTKVHVVKQVGLLENLKYTESMALLTSVYFLYVHNNFIIKINQLF